MSTGTATSPFTGTANNTDGGNYERPPTGTHPAVVIGLIDMGTHTRTFKDPKTNTEKSWEQRKILFVWELTAEADKEGNNFVFGQEFAWTFKKDSDLRKLCEAWFGPFNHGETCDFGRLLGQSCVITLTEGISKNGKKFTELMSMSKPMRGMNVPPATQAPFAYSLTEQASTKDDPPIPSWVPVMYGKKVVDEIKASAEWRQLAVQHEMQNSSPF